MVYFIPIIYKIFIYNMLFMYYYESVSFYESFVKVFPKREKYEDLEPP